MIWIIILINIRKPVKKNDRTVQGIKLVSGDPYTYPIPDDNTDRITQSCFCEKIGGEVSIYAKCGDTNPDDEEGRKHSGWSGSVYDKSRANHIAGDIITATADARITDFGLKRNSPTLL